MLTQLIQPPGKVSNYSLSNYGKHAFRCFLIGCKQQFYNLTYSEEVTTYSIPVAVISLPVKKTRDLYWRIKVNEVFILNLTFISFNSHYAGENCCHGNSKGVQIRNFHVPECPYMGKNIYLRKRIISSLYAFYCGNRHPFSIYTKPDVAIRMEKLSDIKVLKLSYQLHDKEIGLSSSKKGR